MLKKLGLVTKDHDTAPSSPPASSSTDKDKIKAHHNKKVLKTTASVDSLDSASIAPRPHLPSSVYNPNPFPLDPSLPDGLSRFHGFVATEESSSREEENVEIEVEERRGFVSGKSRQSIDHIRESHAQETLSVNEVEDVEYELANRTQNPIQRLNAGLKGALAKSGLGKTKERQQDPTVLTQEVDAVLQHHQRLQEQQQQRQQQQWTSSQQMDPTSRPFRGREHERNRQRTHSGPSYSSGLTRTAFLDDRALSSEREPAARLQSLSPPPTRGQIGARSDSYWPQSTDYDEQKSPFLGYQSPPPTRRPLSQTSDSDGELSRLGRDGRDGRDGRYRSRERQGSDRMRREVLATGGQRRQSGLNNVISIAAIGRTSSELGTDDELSGTGDRGSGSEINPGQQSQLPDRLSRAKEWVATHSHNNSVVALPEPAAAERARPLTSAQRSAPLFSREEYSRHRLSMDSEEFAIIAPPRGSYLSNPGSRGIDSRERMAMMDQMQMQGLSRHLKDSFGEPEPYWSDQLEYERDRYGVETGSDLMTKENMYGGIYGRHYGYGQGGEADDEDESTLAPGSTAGGVARVKKTVNTTPDPNQVVSMPLGDGESQLGMDNKAPPNKRRLILRIITLASSLLVLVLLVAAAPVSASLL
jgi:hypothetical protein